MKIIISCSHILYSLTLCLQILDGSGCFVLHLHSTQFLFVNSGTSIYLNFMKKQLSDVTNNGSAIECKVKMTVSVLGF